MPRISLPLHRALELGLGILLLLMALAHVADDSLTSGAAALAAFIVGVFVIALGISSSRGRASVGVAAHRGADRLVICGLIAGAVAAATTGDAAGTILLLVAGATEALLIASTRYAGG